MANPAVMRVKEGRVECIARYNNSKTCQSGNINSIFRFWACNI